MRRMTAWAIAAALCLVGGLSAQEKPDFSGRWTNTAAALASDANAFCGQECTIAQDAKRLTVTLGAPARPRGELKLTYKLDVKGEPASRSGAELVYRTMWDGAKLVITEAIINPRNRFDYEVRITTLSMNAGQMEVEVSVPDPSGEGRRSKLTYKKS